MKLVFLDAKTMGNVANLHSLERFGEVVYYDTTERTQTFDRVKDADVVVTNKVVIDRTIINATGKLKLICVAATGTNNVDIKAAEEKGIVVKNVADYSTNGVAQVTFAILLHLVNKIDYYDRFVKDGHYADSDIFTHNGKPFQDLNRKRFGIIGLGNIGRKVAQIATAFGCEVVYFSSSGKNNAQPYQRLELDEFLATADIISIHAPLNENTANLINYARLQAMKRTAILINASRGGIVNEADLAKALNDQLIAGACIDVYTSEPINTENPLLQVKEKERIVLTPHIAWASIESRTLLMEWIVQNIEAFLGEKK